MSTKCTFSTLPSPRLNCSVTLSRTMPSSSRQYRSRPRPSNTSCPGVMHHLPPLRRGPSSSLLVAMGTLLHPPELLRPVLNRHLGWRVEPLAGVQRPPCPRGLGEFCEDGSERDAFCTIQLSSPPLHHCECVDCPFGATCAVSGGMACAAQPVLLAHSHNSTRLCDSVRQATYQVQRHSRDFSGSQRCPSLARGDCCPPGKGCNRAGLFS